MVPGGCDGKGSRAPGGRRLSAPIRRARCQTGRERPEDMTVDVLAIGGCLRCALYEPEGLGAALAGGAQEQSVVAAAPIKALCQVEEVSDQKDLDTGAGERQEDLPSDIGALALVRRGKRLVAQK